MLVQTRQDVSSEASGKSWLIMGLTLGQQRRQGVWLSQSFQRIIRLPPNRMQKLRIKLEQNQGETSTAPPVQVLAQANPTS